MNMDTYPAVLPIYVTRIALKKSPFGSRNGFDWNKQKKNVTLALSGNILL